VKIWCATGNPGKLREFRLAGEVLGIEVEPLAGLKSLVAPEETGTTFEANAILKAEYYSRFAPGPVFADDSGLEVDALGGEPGVYSARYAGENATDDENNKLLLARLRGASSSLPLADARGSVTASESAPVFPSRDCEGAVRSLPEQPAQRTARFVCLIALAKGGRSLKTFRGTVEGEILNDSRGPGGFGYDPLFYYPPFGCSFGEVEGEKKFAVSHRGNALRAMLAWLSSSGK
jgi:XTP/dITP diphosphohydrolase